MRRSPSARVVIRKIGGLRGASTLMDDADVLRAYRTDGRDRRGESEFGSPTEPATGRAGNIDAQRL